MSSARVSRRHAAALVSSVLHAHLQGPVTRRVALGRADGRCVLHLLGGASRRLARLQSVQGIDEHRDRHSGLVACEDLHRHIGSVREEPSEASILERVSKDDVCGAHGVFLYFISLALVNLTRPAISKSSAERARRIPTMRRKALPMLLEEETHLVHPLRTPCSLATAPLRFETAA